MAIQEEEVKVIPHKSKVELNIEIHLDELNFQDLFVQTGFMNVIPNDARLEDEERMTVNTTFFRAIVIPPDS